MNKELIKRFFNNTATLEERRKVEVLLADPVYSEDIINYIQSLWETENSETEPVVPFESMFEKAKRREEELGGSFSHAGDKSIWMKMVAACILFLLFGGFAGYILKNKSKSTDKWALSTAQTGKGQSAQLMLSDGSEVLLNEGSKIYFSKDKDVYPVMYLEGEASFKMTKNVKKVVIKTKDLITTTTGSTINISAFPNDSTVTVSVQEGKAEVRTNEESFPLIKLRIPLKDSSAASIKDTTSKKVLPLMKLKPVVVKYNESYVFNKRNGIVDISLTVEDQKANQDD